MTQIEKFQFMLFFSVKSEEESVTFKKKFLSQCSNYVVEEKKVVGRLQNWRLSRFWSFSLLEIYFKRTSMFHSDLNSFSAMIKQDYGLYYSCQLWMLERSWKPTFLFLWLESAVYKAASVRCKYRTFLNLIHSHKHTHYMCTLHTVVTYSAHWSIMSYGNICFRELKN